MAKKKVRPRPGALMELLGKREMTQMEAAQPDMTNIDRKTLAKINRGEEVKLETLQKLATKLHVPVSYFLMTAPTADEVDASHGPMHSVMLRKLDGERLADLIKDADRVEWLLNARVVEKTARELLTKLESTVRATRPTISLSKETLREQLSRLQASDSLAGILQEIRTHRLAVLGADYLFWKRDDNLLVGKLPLPEICYSSFRVVLLSVETSATHSRRARVDPGPEPPESPPTYAIVFVDGRRLDTGELDLSKRSKHLLF
jgi:transcriptional regulator with XRE-family HTH domain